MRPRVSAWCNILHPASSPLYVTSAAIEATSLQVSFDADGATMLDARARPNSLGDIFLISSNLAR